MQVAQHFGLDVSELREWYNSDFYDALEFVAVQQEIDRRTMSEV